MEISKGAASIAAAICLVAGAGSAYLVTRPAPASDAAVSAAEPASVSPDPGSPDPGAPPVEQSEAIVGDPAPAPVDAAATPSTIPEPRATAPVRQPPTRREASSTRPARREAETTDEYVAPKGPEPRVATAPTLAPALPEPEPVLAEVPPTPQFEELIVSADSVIGLEMDSSVTSERARVEDPISARVTRDVRVGDRVAIPAGAQVVGEVTLVERGGKMREKARLGVRFTSVVLADGTRIPLETDTIIREGSSPANESAAKIGGGAIGGAILGGILGGAKGAIIGGSAGAGAGTAAVLAGGRNAATLPSGAPVTVRLLKPATVTIEK